MMSGENEENSVIRISSKMEGKRATYPKASTVRELIGILETRDPESKVIGLTCQELTVVQQDSGAVLIG